MLCPPQVRMASAAFFLSGDAVSLSQMLLEELSISVRQCADSYGKLRRALESMALSGTSGVLNVVRADGSAVSLADMKKTIVQQQSSACRGGDAVSLLPEAGSGFDDNKVVLKGVTTTAVYTAIDPISAPAQFISSPCVARLLEASCGIRYPLPVVALAVLQLGGRIVALPPLVRPPVPPAISFNSLAAAIFWTASLASAPFFTAIITDFL